MAKSFVIVSRKWHSPQIEVTYGDEGIGISMPMEDFLKALTTHCVHPLHLWTRTSLVTAIERSAAAVREEMKLSTISNPPPTGW